MGLQSFGYFYKGQFQTLIGIAINKVFEAIYVMTQGIPTAVARLFCYIYELTSRIWRSYACTVGMVLFSIVLSLSLLGLEAQHFTL